MLLTLRGNIHGRSHVSVWFIMCGEDGTSQSQRLQKFIAIVFATDSILSYSVPMFKSSWNKLPLTLRRESVAITIPASPWQRFYIFFTVDVFFLPTCFVGLALGLWLCVVMGCSFRGEGLGWMLEFGEPLKPRHTTKPLIFFLCIFWAEGRGWFVVVVLCCVALCFSFSLNANLR